LLALTAAAILAAMSSSEAELIRTIYGIDWTAVDARTRGLAAAGELLSPDIQARISPEVGDRVLEGIADFATFVEGLEEDFSEFRYDVETAEDTAPGEVVLTGVIRARGRRSRMPLSAPFSHSWSFVDGRAVRVEASLNPQPGFSASRPV
jgi:ketosteroid isomerase-like protein